MEVVNMDLEYYYECDLCKLKKKLVKYEFIKEVHHNDKYSTGKSQYTGLHWIKCFFSDDVNITNDVFKNCIGFHIMPYSIKNIDIILDNNSLKIVKSDSKNDFKNQGDSFTDYDKGSGNMHKKPDRTYQIVLITADVSPQGPGWKNGKAPSEDENYEDFTGHIKQDWYYPNFFGDQKPKELKTSDDVLKALDGVFEELGLIEKK